MLSMGVRCDVHGTEIYQPTMSHPVAVEDLWNKTPKRSLALPHRSISRLCLPQARTRPPSLQLYSCKTL